MLSDYLCQQVSHQRKSGVDAYGQTSYQESTIKARKERKQRLVKDQYGKDVLSETTVFTATEVNPGDRIDGKVVLSVYDLVNREGETLGYEVML